jgi:Mitochondrial carrier protein
MYDLFVQDLICGSFGGLAYILTAHPLDSIKVRMQLERRPNINLRKIIMETYTHEGFSGFYKGMGSPLITIPLVNSIVFASYEFAKRCMGVQHGEECTFNQSLIAGMFGGFMNSFVLSPIELVKCRLQVQRECK